MRVGVLIPDLLGSSNLCSSNSKAWVALLIRNTPAAPTDPAGPPAQQLQRPDGEGSKCAADLERDLERADLERNWSGDRPCTALNWLEPA
jgi:hypothetical protein